MQDAAEMEPSLPHSLSSKCCGVCMSASQAGVTYGGSVVDGQFCSNMFARQNCPEGMWIFVFVTRSSGNEGQTEGALGRAAAQQAGLCEKRSCTWDETQGRKLGSQRSTTSGAQRSIYLSVWPVVDRAIPLAGFHLLE